MTAPFPTRWPISPPSPSPTRSGDFGGGAVNLLGRQRTSSPSSSSTAPRASAGVCSPARECPERSRPSDFRTYAPATRAERPVGHPVVLHRGGQAVHLLRGAREPRPAWRPGARGSTSFLPGWPSHTRSSTGRTRPSPVRHPWGTMELIGLYLVACYLLVVGRRGQGRASRRTRPAALAALPVNRLSLRRVRWFVRIGSVAETALGLVALAAPGPLVAWLVAASYAAFARGGRLRPFDRRCPGQLWVLRDSGHPGDPAPPGPRHGLGRGRRGGRRGPPGRDDAGGPGPPAG